MVQGRRLPSFVPQHEMPPRLIGHRVPPSTRGRAQHQHHQTVEANSWWRSSMTRRTARRKEEEVQAVDRRAAWSPLMARCAATVAGRRPPGDWAVTARAACAVKVDSTPGRSIKVPRNELQSPLVVETILSTCSESVIVYSIGLIASTAFCRNSENGRSLIWSDLEFDPHGGSSL